jgi:5'-3' exonuclease
MLSLNHLRFCEQISLYRETPHFIQNIDNSISPDQAYLMDINALAFQLLEELGSNITNQSSYRSQAHAYNVAHVVTKLISDYILISFILGNDFLPHAPAFNIRTKGMQILMNNYREHFGKKGLFLTDPLSTPCSIDWKNFRLFLEKLGEQELSNLQREHRQRDKLESLPPRVREGDDPFLAKLDSLPVHIRAKERYIAPEHDDWQRRYYKVTLDATLADRKTICTDYLKTLEWNFKYYTSGCPDWRWTYRFRCAPLIQDLAKHVPIFASELMPFTEPRPVSAITQLAYVLPISTHHYLPDKVQSNLHKYMSEYYGENYEIDWTYCKYFWESHAVLPEMHLDKLETLTRRF